MGSHCSQKRGGLEKEEVVDRWNFETLEFWLLRIEVDIYLVNKQSLIHIDN